MSIDARSFLDSIAGYTDNNPNVAPTSADRPIKLATINPLWTSGACQVTFDGETLLSGKSYFWLSSYTPVAGQRVVMIPVGQSYVIAGAAIGAVPAAPPLSSNRLIGLAENTADSGGVSSTTDAIVIICTVPVVAGALYRIMFTGMTESTVATDLAVMKIKASSNQLQQFTNRANSGTASQSNGFTVSVIWTATSTTSIQFQGTLNRGVGTGVCKIKAGATFPTQLSVEALPAI